MTLQAGYEPLLEAIRDGNVPALKHILYSKQYSVNTEIPYISEDGKTYLLTPLYWAVKTGQKDICQLLLQENADPYLHMVYEYYPLHEACNRGDKGIVEVFVKSGCDLNRTNCDGDTPLHIASMRGHIDCIRLLLMAGVDHTVKNIKGQTPLQTAQYTNQTDLHKLFELFQRENTFIHRKAKHATVSSSKLQRPLSGDYRTYSSVNSVNAPIRVSSYAKDDTIIHSHSSKPSCVRSDLTRAYSFSGKDLHQKQKIENVKFKSPLVRTPPNYRPSLINMSHDSQLILPTQPLINDPRRTQTYHDFSESLYALEDARFPPSPIDEVEMDSGSSQTYIPKLRVSHLIQHLNQSVIDKYGEGLDSTQLKLLPLVHSDLNLSQPEYASLRRLNGTFGDTKMDSCHNDMHLSNNNIEYVWGCDYEMIDRNPLHVRSGSPTIHNAEITCRVRLLSSVHSNQNSILKVAASIFDLCNEEDSVAYHAGSHGDVSSTSSSSVVTSIPPHPNIAQLLYHCTAHSRPFERFTGSFASQDVDYSASIKMAPSVLLLFFKEHSMVFEKYLSVKKQLHVRSPYGMEEKTALMFLSQLLLGLAHLDQQGIIMSYLAPCDIMFGGDHFLKITGFSQAINVIGKNPLDIRNYLQDHLLEVTLKYPPELIYLRDCSSNVVPDMSYLNDYFKTSNSYSAARFFLDIFTEESLNHLTADNLPPLNCFSSNLQNIIKIILSSSKDERPTALESAMSCLILLYGPTIENCRTLRDCQQWLASETCHFFLKPSLKGQPPSYQNDVNTTLFFIYLTIATPNSIFSASKLAYNTIR